MLDTPEQLPLRTPVQSTEESREFKFKVGQFAIEIVQGEKVKVLERGKSGGRPVYRVRGSKSKVVGWVNENDLVKFWSSDEMGEYIQQMPEEFLNRPLLRLWERQTPDERATHETRYQNARGFNAFDAEFAGAMVDKWREYGRFTPKQAAAVRKMLKKYRKQLAEIANYTTVERMR